MDRQAEEEFREFVVARSPALLATAYLLTGDRGTAEDLVQATLLRAYRHWQRVRATGNPEAYLRRMLVNQRTTWWRRRRPTEYAVDAVPEISVQDGVASLAQRDELWRALHRLPPRMRAVLVLRYWEDMSETDAAAVLGCAVGTVKSLASRGLQRLRSVLDESNGAATPEAEGARR